MKTIQTTKSRYGIRKGRHCQIRKDTEGSSHIRHIKLIGTQPLTMVSDQPVLIRDAFEPA